MSINTQLNVENINQFDSGSLLGVLPSRTIPNGTVADTELFLQYTAVDGKKGKERFLAKYEHVIVDKAKKLCQDELQKTFGVVMRKKRGRPKVIK